jgi:general secretion pathway protein D
VIADKPTNSLIVLSTGRDFLALREVITALDQPRPQVYIEAMIVEVGVGDDVMTDGSLHGATAIDKAMVLGGVHTTDSFTSTSLKSSGAAKGIVAGIIGPSASILGLTIPSYGVLFNALADKTRANVLSTPSVMALDNEVAKFKSGKNIPYISRTTFGSTTSTDSPFGSASQSIDRIDLNLELEVKPHISSDSSVLLELKHDAKEQGDMTSIGPTWNNRSFETRVLVRDQQTIVIGGLMQEKLITSSSQVPFLGDLPLLGYLFKSTQKRKRKSNLLILLTPYIVRNQMELEHIKARKVREHEEFVGALQAFDAMKYQPKIDYGRKRGLVEEINRSLLGVEADAAAIKSVRRSGTIPSGAIELPTEP